MNYYHSDERERMNTYLRCGNDASDLLQTTDDLLSFSLTGNGEDDRKGGRKGKGDRTRREVVEGRHGKYTNTRIKVTT